MNRKILCMLIVFIVIGSAALFAINPDGVQQRIDYILASTALIDRFVYAVVPVNEKTKLNSDHYPVYTDLKMR